MLTGETVRGTDDEVLHRKRLLEFESITRDLICLLQPLSGRE